MSISELEIENSLPDLSVEQDFAVDAPYRYERLDLLDRHAAETLNQFCKAHSVNETSARKLADIAVWQSVATSLPLAISDFLSLYLSLLFTTIIYAPFLNEPGHAFRGLPALFIALTIIPMSQLSGLYPGLGLSSPLEFRQVVRSLFAALLIFVMGACFFLPHSLEFVTVIVGTTFFIAVPTMLTSRYIARRLASRWSKWGVPVFIVAEPERGYEFFRRLQAVPEQGFRPVGVLFDSEHYWGTASHDAAGNLIPTFDMRNADQAALENSVTWVVVSPCANRATPSLDPSLAVIPNRLFLSSAQMDMGLWDRLYNVGSTIGLHSVGRPGSIKLLVKRLLDFSLSVVGLVVLSPFLFLAAILIKLSSPGPVLYSQERIGMGGEKFKAYKFRTMRVGADKILGEYLQNSRDARNEWDRTHKLTKDPRVTRIGRFLRASSLDEIPQLWNVIVGEMSLAGPRPIINAIDYDARYIEQYPEEFEVYKTVRPGLTGLWQIQCRNRGVYDLRIYWDMYYIRNWCIWLDMYLIMRTIKTVLFREGA